VPALRQRVTEFNTGDLVSVYGIVLLIVAIVFAPFIAKYVLHTPCVVSSVHLVESSAWLTP
jgi:ABC-type antimicrobial peptide transport system permease subunit